MGTPGAVNIHYFVWKLLSATYKFSFIYSSDQPSGVCRARSRTKIPDFMDSYDSVNISRILYLLPEHTDGGVLMVHGESRLDFFFFWYPND